MTKVQSDAGYCYHIVFLWREQKEIQKKYDMHMIITKW